jgi:flagellar motor switch protein FliN/FliY
MTHDTLEIPDFLDARSAASNEPSSERQPAARPVALPSLPPAQDGPGAAVLERSSPLLQISVRLSARVGETELTLGELTAARAGDVLALDTLVAQPIDLVLNDSVVARGVLVAIDEHFAVRLTEVPAPLRF